MIVGVKELLTKKYEDTPWKVKECNWL